MLPGLFYDCHRWSSSPYINHFIQPDTIVPVQVQGVQAWDRYAYVNNNPTNYDDPSGHFSCQNNSTVFQGDRKKIIEQWLAILNTKGGKDGQNLVKAFRAADQRTYCVHGLCSTEKDLITININDSGAVQYGTDGHEQKDNNFNVASSLLGETDPNNVSDLDVVGAFGHEIAHLAYGSGGLHDEVNAFSTQYQLYENMGIQDQSLPYVNAARIVKDYEGASDFDIMTSDWATDHYNNMPLYHQWWFLDKPIRWFAQWKHDTLDK